MASWIRAALTVFVALSGLGTPARSAAQAAGPVVAIEGESLTVTGPEDGALPRRFSLGCVPIAHRVDPAMVGGPSVFWLHVACTTKVLRIELSPAGAVVVAEVHLAYPVVGSHETESDTWLEFADGSGRSIRMVTPQLVPSPALGAVPPPPPPGAAGTAPSPPERRPIVGSVSGVNLEERTCVINVGSDHGVYEGATVVMSAAEITLDRESVVVGQVQRTTADSALVALPYNARVEVGQRAELGDRRSRSTRPALGEWPYRASLRLNVRPALVLNNVGVTAAVDAEALLHAGVGVFALRLSSTGFTAARREEPSPYGYDDADTGADFGFGGAFVLGGVDVGFLSVALGVGVSAAFRENDDDISGFMEPVVTMPLRMRVGMEDGIHGELTSLFAFQGGELRWLGIEVRGQLPAGRLWLFVEGAGGFLPTFHAIAGARFALRGNGQPGSWSLRVGIGGAGTTALSPADTVRVGPALHVGFDTRL